MGLPREPRPPGHILGSSAREGRQVSRMPQQRTPDPQEQLERYEKEIHQLQTQIKFLEDETALLRRRLTNSPRQVKVLEEQVLQTKGDLARAAAQNEKLATVLRSEREKVEALKEEVEKLA